MIASVICLFVALLAVAIGMCFECKTQFLKILLHTAFLIVLVCLGICVTTFAGNFGGFEILLFTSVVPLFLQICVLKSQNDEDDENLEQSENLPENNDFSSEMPQKSENSIFLLQILKKFVTPVAFLISSICIFFCGLYVGKESFLGVIVAIAIALVAAFLDTTITKDIEWKDIFKALLKFAEKFVLFLSVGFVLAAVLLALQYSLSATNILFSLGAIVYASHMVVGKFWHSRFNHLFLAVAYVLLFISILV